MQQDVGPQPGTQGIERRQSFAAVHHNSDFIYQPASFIQICDLPTLATHFVQSHSQYTYFATPRISVNQPHSGARSTRLSRIVFLHTSYVSRFHKNKTLDIGKSLAQKNKDIWNIVI